MIIIMIVLDLFKFVLHRLLHAANRSCYTNLLKSLGEP